MKTLYIDHDLLKYCTQKCIIKTKGKKHSSLSNILRFIKPLILKSFLYIENNAL